MIDKIYIPTIGRNDRQITWNNLSDKWKEKTIIVVDESEYNEYSSLYPSVLSLPKGMKGIAPIREWIVKQATEEKMQAPNSSKHKLDTQIVDSTDSCAYCAVEGRV